MPYFGPPATIKMPHFVFLTKPFHQCKVWIRQGETIVKNRLKSKMSCLYRVWNEDSNQSQLQGIGQVHAQIRDQVRNYIEENVKQQIWGKMFDEIILKKTHLV